MILFLLRISTLREHWTYAGVLLCGENLHLPRFSLILGLFLEHCLSTMRSLAQDADFVMAIGDDSSDEPMFQVSGHYS